MIDSYQYCQEKTSKSGSSFYYSFLFLPPEKRKAITVVYAFCREVDDVVDNATNPEVAEIKLKWWQAEIEKVFHGTPEHPVGKALKEVLKQYNLKKHIFLEIIEGMAMDLKYQGYKTFSDLKLYCHCVASTVGMLAAEIFGYKNIKTLEYARNLGIAFQLVNIIRDVGEDATRGRIYLPEEDLNKFNIKPNEILQNKLSNSKKFESLMQFQAKRAHEYYKKALELLPKEDRPNQKTGLIMAKVYFGILERVEKLKFNVLNQRISISPIKKLWLAWRANRAENKFVVNS